MNVPRISWREIKWWTILSLTAIGMFGCFSEQLVSARFDDVGLLSEGDPLFESGVKIGRVRRIELKGVNTIVTVGLLAGRELYAMDTLEIQHAGAFGERQLLLRRGQPRKKCTEYDTLFGVYYKHSPG